MNIIDIKNLAHPSLNTNCLHQFDELTFGTVNFNINVTIFIDILLLIAIICATSTILSKNPILSVLFLIGLYISVASYILLIGMQFIGISYILIYVGAVSILFIFILMLINIRISEIINNSINSTPLIMIITIILNSVLFSTLPAKNILESYIYNIGSYQNNLDEIYNIKNIKWDSTLVGYNTISSLGNTLYTDNFIFFIETSLILLLAMIGAIIITINNKPTSQ